MKYLIQIDEKPFHGSISPIRDLSALFKKVYDRVYALDMMNDDKGKLRPVESFTECELLGILRAIARFDIIELCDSLEDARALSTVAKYQSLCDSFELPEPIVN
ncbi:hypothetical protein [Vibrio sp. Hal054]|uniref:hypothetical protein n=1 Tax=Vibrio sp. Hal054 TaxID=3035158 RepID=UPI00301D6B7C